MSSNEVPARAHDHGACGIRLRRPANRLALRRRLRRRAVRPPAPRAVRRRRDAAAEAAFAALVARHGPMVLDVCRQLLGDHQHAEDAFQAVFLVLARQARAVRDPDLLSNWLYGVALRTARKARVRLARRRKNEEDHAMERARRPGSSRPGRSVGDGPRAGRDPPRRDRPTAHRSACPWCSATSKASRSTRPPTAPMARRHRPQSTGPGADKLRRGLTRRGVVLPAAALAAVLERRPASASVSSPLCDITTRAAIDVRGRTMAVAPAGGSPGPGGAPDPC